MPLGDRIYREIGTWPSPPFYNHKEVFKLFKREDEIIGQYQKRFPQIKGSNIMVNVDGFEQYMVDFGVKPVAKRAPLTLAA